MPTVGSPQVTGHDRNPQFSQDSFHRLLVHQADVQYRIRIATGREHARASHELGDQPAVRLDLKLPLDLTDHGRNCRVGKLARMMGRTPRVGQDNVRQAAQSGNRSCRITPTHEPRSVRIFAVAVATAH